MGAGYFDCTVLNPTLFTAALLRRRTSGLADSVVKSFIVISETGSEVN